jgi:hypothetical protein
MNTCVQAGPLTLSFVAVINEVKVSTTNVVMVVSNFVDNTCLHTFKVSVNGHSLKAINPDFDKVGELTTLIAA